MEIKVIDRNFWKKKKNNNNNLEIIRRTFFEFSLRPPKWRSPI